MMGPALRLALLLLAAPAFLALGVAAEVAAFAACGSIGMSLAIVLALFAAASLAWPKHGDPLAVHALEEG